MPSGYTYRVPITLDNGGGPSLAGAQVEITIPSSFDFAACLTSGFDLLVTDSDGSTLLPFWRQAWDKAGTSGTLWVKLTSLAAGATGTIYLYYGKAGASDASSYDNTMQKLVSQTGTLALYHCDTGSGTSLVDATGTYTGTITGGSWVGADGGYSGGTTQAFASGDSFSVSGSGYTASAGLLDTMPASGHVMLWFYPLAAVTSGFPHVFTKSTGGTSTTSKYIRAYFENSGQLNFQTVNGDGSAGTVAECHSIRTSWSGAWYHLCFVWSPDCYQLWVNGRLEGHVRAKGVFPVSGTSNPFSLGSFYQTDSAVQYYSASPQSLANAAFDEVQVGNYQISPEEIHAAYYRRKHVTGYEESGRWGSVATVLSPTGTTSFDGAEVLEPSIMDPGTGTLRMTYTGYNPGHSSTLGDVGLATSTDSGTTWTRYVSNPVISNSQQQSTLRDPSDGKYYWFGITSGAATVVRYVSSDDGQTWGAATTVFTHSAGTWTDIVSNTGMWIEGSTWYCLLEGADTSLVYRLGLFSSTDKGITWTAVGTNPIAALQPYSASSASGPTIQVIGTRRHIWYHTCPVAATEASLPSSISHAYTDDLATWTITNGGDPVIMLAAESVTGNAADQKADPFFYTDGTNCYLFYETGANAAVASSGGIAFRIDRLTFPGTVANLVKPAAMATFGAEGSGSGVTISFAAAAQSAAVALSVTNTPPARTVTFTAAAQSASGSLTVTNVPPASLVTLAGAAQSAAAALTVTNTAPAGTVTFAASAQAASASLTAANTPPASLVTLAGSAQSASVALTVTNTAPAGSVTFAAAAQPATGSFTATNTPPASLVTLSGSAQAASVSLTVTNTQPAGTISFAAAAQAASGSFNATNTPPASVVTFAGQGQPATVALAVTNTLPPGLVTVTAAAQSAAAAFTVTGTLPPGTITFAAVARPASASFTVTYVAPAVSPYPTHVTSVITVSPGYVSGVKVTHR